MTDYKIKILGLKDGVLTNSFKIRKSFFNKFIHSEVTNADILAHTLLKKKNNSLSLTIELTGRIHDLLCDICAEKISIDISLTTKMIIQESTENLDSNDEIIYIKPNEHEININQLLFELINLSLPKKRQHKLNSNGSYTCNQKMIDLITQYSTIKAKTSDPRWDKLKKIKIK